MGKTLLRFSENSFAVFVLLLSTSPLLQILKSGASENPNSSEGYPLLQTLWFCIYLVVVFLLCLRWKRFIYTALKNKYLLLLISVPLLSVVWSIAPLITLRRSVGLVGTTLFGIYLTSRYSLKEQLRLLAWALGIATVFSIIFVVALPNYGINWHQNGSWQGIYHQKNILGRHMSLAAIAYLLLALDARRSRWLPWTLFFLSTTLLLLSTSKTALVAFLSVAILLPLYRALRFPFNIRVPFFISAILIGGSVVMVFVSNVETILTALGKDLTLTGRTELWLLLLEFVKRKPWLGYGYSGFWAGSSEDVWALLVWKPIHAHNGFLQLTLDVGVIGLSVVGISFIATAFKAVAWVKLTKSTVNIWPLALLAFIFFNNIAESVFLEPNNVFWILYVSTATSMTAGRVRDRKTSHTNKMFSQGGSLKSV